MFAPCPHCGFLVALATTRHNPRQRCPRCDELLRAEPAAKPAKPKAAAAAAKPEAPASAAQEVQAVAPDTPAAPPAPTASRREPGDGAPRRKAASTRSAMPPPAVADAPATPDTGTEVPPEPAMPDVVADDAVTGDAMAGDAVTGDVVTGDVVTGDVVTGDVVISDVVISDVVAGDVVTGDVATSDVATGDVAASDVATSDAVTSDAVTSDVVTSDVVTSDVATSDVATGDAATGDAVAGDVVPGDVVPGDVAPDDDADSATTLAPTFEDSIAAASSIAPTSARTAPPRRRSAAARGTPSFARIRQPTPPRQRHWRGPVAVAALSLLLVLQLLLAQRAELAAQARWRPVVAAVCGVLRCELPPWREPAAFSMLGRNVQPKPGMAGVLTVSASFRNDARWPQPWPTIVLSLSDIDGRQVGQRAFAPAEYRDRDAADLLAPGQSAAVQLDVIEPAPRIVAFTFDFK